jgi:dGTPase
MPLYHTRLTHSLKVQQLARRIAERLNRLEEEEAVDVNAAEAAGLAHDLGHPPFGHVAEAVLDDECRARGLDGFEGNAQTFRLLAKTLQRKPGEPGLGLSRKTLNAVIKYPYLREGTHAEEVKWNAYLTEREEFERARADSLGEMQSTEASIMDWADDITYAVHDLEDFIRAGRVPIAALLRDTAEFEKFWAYALPRVNKKVPTEAINWKDFKQEFRDLLSLLFDLETGFINSPEERASLRQACSLLINHHVTSVSLGELGGPIDIPFSVRAEVEFLKQVTWRYVIHHPDLATLQVGHEALIRSLFRDVEDLLSRCIAENSLFRAPSGLRHFHNITSKDHYKAYEGNATAGRARAVADYLASLTECQAVTLSNRLRGHTNDDMPDSWLNY